MKANGRKSADQKIIVALAGGQTVQAAARAAGVGESTVFRRLRDAAFRGAVAAARAEVTARALGKLAAASTAAASTLRKLLNAESEAVKLSAARSILELGTKLREAVELEQRIVALEAKDNEYDETKVSNGADRKPRKSTFMPPT